jgi:hypothetical protein
LISDLGVEGGFLQSLVGTRTRPPIGNLFYGSFGGILHNLLPERKAFLALHMRIPLGAVGSVANAIEVSNTTLQEGIGLGDDPP